MNPDDINWGLFLDNGLGIKYSIIERSRTLEFDPTINDWVLREPVSRADCVHEDSIWPDIAQAKKNIRRTSSAWMKKQQAEADVVAKRRAALEKAPNKVGDDVYIRGKIVGIEICPKTGRIINVVEFNDECVVLPDSDIINPRHETENHEPTRRKFYRE